MLINDNCFTIDVSISSDFAGLAGLSIATIGTIALAGEVGKTIRGYSKPVKRKSTMKKKSGKKKKMASLSDIRGRYY